MGLRIKLLLVWFALVLSPIAILAGIGYAYIDSQLKKEVIYNQADVAHSLAGAGQSYLNRLHYLTANTARHSDIQDLLKNNPAKRRAVESMLATLIASDDSIETYYVYSNADLSQPLVATNSAPVDAAVTQAIAKFSATAQDTAATHFIQLQNQANTATPRETGRLLTLLPVYGDGKTLTGYLASVASTAPLLKLVMPQQNRDAELLFVTADGDVITSTPSANISRMPAIAAITPKALDGFMDNFALGNGRYLLRLSQLNQHFWLVSLADKQKLWEKKLPYIFIFIMALSLTLLVSGLVFNLFVNHIAIKPIQVLIGATRQIAKGEFRPELKLRSKDELGELAVAFRQMGKQLMHTSRRIRQLAYYDPLTQLPNRTTLRETLNRLLARGERNKTKCAVLFIDLDDFKKVNDRLGHEAGDELLIQISDRLKNRLRQADVLFEQAGITSVDQLISRRGGDEFNAILSAIKAPHDAAIVAERIIQDLNEPFFIAKSELNVGASVGIAIFPDDGRDADTLLRNADLAMYEAKARGKNNYHIFTSAINEQVHQRLELEQALQIAMVQSQFRLYYQPKVRLSDMKPVGFEALIRWHHPEKGVILPGKFIPVAEESNLIRDIGNWILGESMQQIQLWEHMLPPGLRIAINISARQLSQIDLVEQLQTMMEHFNLSPSRLEIELTETSVLHDEAMASQHLAALRKLGVEVSLDDFGTGYSSLSFLRKLPIDTVKIDRSFTANVMHNSEARAIVVSLLSLCRELKVKTIAEGIETTSQLQFLLDHGCDQGQGFLFSEPLPSDEVEAFLAEPSYIA